MNSFQHFFIFSLSMWICFLEFYRLLISLSCIDYLLISLLISLKLRSTLNLTLRLQTLQTLLSSKLWYHSLAMELSILGNHEQISNKTWKIKVKTKIEAMSFMSFSLYCWSEGTFTYFSLSNTYILIQKESITNSGFAIWSKQLYSLTSAHTKNALGMFSFAWLKWTWTSQGEWSFAHLEGLQMYLN